MIRRDLRGLSTAGHLHPRFGGLSLGHDNFKPSRASKTLEVTVCLELIRHKDGSIVSISKISEVIVSNLLFVLDAVKLAVIL